MNDLDLQLVREFFELNLFRVMPFWQRSDRDPHFFVENALAPSSTEPEFELDADSLAAIARAAVSVRAWHADRFYASVIEANPAITAFAQRQSYGAARALFGDAEYKHILVLSELPVSPAPRAAALQALVRAEVDHVIEFSTLLDGLVRRVGENGTYASSASLQLIQLFKRYRFFQQQQLELGFPMEPPQAAVHVVESSAAATEEDPGPEIELETSG